MIKFILSIILFLFINAALAINPGFKIYPNNYGYYNPAYSNSFPTITLSSKYFTPRLGGDMIFYHLDYRQRFLNDRLTAGVGYSSVYYPEISIFRYQYSPSFLMAYNILNKEDSFWGVGGRVSIGNLSYTTTEIFPAIEVATYYSIINFHFGAGAKYQHLIPEYGKYEDWISFHIQSGVHFDILEGFRFSPSALIVYDHYNLHTINNGSFVIRGVFTFNEILQLGANLNSDETYPVGISGGVILNRWKIAVNINPSSYPYHNTAIEGAISYQFKHS